MQINYGRCNFKLSLTFNRMIKNPYCKSFCSVQIQGIRGWKPAVSVIVLSSRFHIQDHYCESFLGQLTAYEMEA
jgi:hypothetical protein